MTWIKTAKTVKADGTTVNKYTAREQSRITIESRKRPIPHASGSGFWMHTSFFVLVDGTEIKERFSLRDAKAFAEKLQLEEDLNHG